MSDKFKNGDRVTTGLDKKITGRVVGQHNLNAPTGGCFYTILMDERIEGFPWATVVLPESMLDKQTVLDDMAQDKRPNCPWCGGDE